MLQNLLFLLLSMNWWDDLWLNEGFVIYVQNLLHCISVVW
jgi:hypothetical protein